MASAPRLHILAGPNGAGKSTLYNERIAPRYPNVEFINADLLAKAHYGHNAVTHEESLKGQELADSRRKQLMAEKKSLITESTFSHPSKLDLIREAKAAGYKVIVHHVNVRSPDISVGRVQSRVEKGGHPVPEAKIRERYERNQPLIKQAVLMADRAAVWDNSRMGKAPDLAIEFEKGRAVSASKSVPAWAQKLYEAELTHFSKSRLNAPAASFAEAREIIDKKDPGAAVHIARPGRYKGAVVAETSLHLVQQLSVPQGATKEAGSYVAHFKKSLEKIPEIGRAVEIAHAIGKVSTVTDLAQLTSREKSLAAAEKIAAGIAAGKALVEQAARGHSYKGPVLAETTEHLLQGGDAKNKFVAHAKGELASKPAVGRVVDISYSSETGKKAVVSDYQPPAKAKIIEQELDR